jgi:hypothetical protein
MKRTIQVVEPENFTQLTVKISPQQLEKVDGVLRKRGMLLTSGSSLTDHANLRLNEKCTRILLNASLTEIAYVALFLKHHVLGKSSIADFAERCYKVAGAKGYEEITERQLSNLNSKNGGGDHSPLYLLLCDELQIPERQRHPPRHSLSALRSKN